MSNIKQSVACACKDAGILYGRYVKGGFILHDIRRTVKTNMVSAKVDEVYRDILLGHKKKGMDAHYIHPSENDLHKAMSKYAAWLEDKIAGVDQNVDQVASENQ